MSGTGRATMPLALVALGGGIALAWNAVKGKRIRDAFATTVPPTAADQKTTVDDTSHREDLIVPAPLPSALGLVGGNATTQRMQAGLPKATQVVWKALVSVFGVRIRSLGAWAGGDRDPKDFTCHTAGKAIDAHPVNKAAGDAIAAWAVANHATYDIRVVVWYEHKCSQGTGWKWVAYHGDSPHKDHVHMSIGCNG